VTAFWFIYSSVFEGRGGTLEVYRRFRTTAFPELDTFYDEFFHRAFSSASGKIARAVVEDGAIQELRAAFPFYSVNDAKFRLIRDRALPPAQYEQIMDGMMAARGVQVEELAKGLWMSDDHLRYLSRHGHVVGLHSYSHPTVLAALSCDEQREEYAQNAAHLSAVCGQRPVAMAHPANSYNDETLAIVRELGIRCGFRSNSVPPRPGGVLNPSVWELAREDHANLVRGLTR